MELRSRLAGRGYQNGPSNLCLVTTSAGQQTLREKPIRGELAREKGRTKKGRRLTSGHESSMEQGREKAKRMELALH